MIGIIEMKTKDKLTLSEKFIYFIGAFCYLGLGVMFLLTAYGFIYAYFFA
jgi:hypothetical protein